MFGYALRHPKMPASNGIANVAGLTPLTLACKLGRAKVFREMLELSAREFWRYSNITCSAYPLNALDTLLPDGRTNWNSALFIILNGTKEEHLDMLDGGIIQRLLEEKWKTFARRQFLKRLVILMLHLLCLSGAVYLRPTDRTKPLLGGDDWKSVARQGFEVATVLGVLSYVIVQQGGEIRNQGFISFIKQLDPAKAIFLVSNILILICIPFRLMDDKRTEEAILVFAVPGSWFLLMFFAGAVRLTGPFVTMVYSMIVGDMFTFGIIYSIVLFGFSQSFYFLYKGFPGVKNTLYSSYHSTWMALFQITLGDYNYAELSHTSYPTLSKTVFAIFMILVPILLLNMLIAMMGNTYAHVIEQSEKEWMKQWAKIVVSLERAVNQEDCKQYLQEYSIKLGPGDDPSTEQRGVMVIKSKSKTRAKQRKGAVANWKRVGKVTINELRKRGMNGEQLRRIMWDRASISTPVKVPQNPVVDVLMENTAEQQAQQTPGSFGGALTAALDVMAFTHDLDLSASGITSSGLNAKELIVSDPFRDLVLSSEIDVGEEELATLAEAAVLSVMSGQSDESEKLKIAKFNKQISFEQNAVLEVSDSDGFLDGQPLGQGSRARKVKSAQERQRAERTWGGTSISSIEEPPPYLPLPPPPPLHSHQRPRPKTAKPNRVVPEAVVAKRPQSSALGDRVKSPPELLEPWSTRGIATINTILAWQPSDQDSM